MAKKSEIDAAVAGTANNGRAPMGDTASKLGNVAQPLFGTERPRGNTQSGVDPSVGTKVQRGQVLQGRLGARYAISVTFAKQESPEAGNTQANGRIVKGFPGSGANFRDQSGRMG